MLLSLSGAFGPLHPGVRTAWLQWGRDFLRLPSMVATSPSLDQEQDEDEDESENIPLNASSVSGGGGDVGARATTLGQSFGGSHLDKDKGKGILKGTWTRDPLSPSDPALRASMRGK